MRKKQFDEFIVPAVIGDYRGMQGRRRRAVLQLPRRPRARNPRRDARSGFRRLSAQAHSQVRRRRRHDAIQRRPRQADADDLPAADACRTSSARWSPTPAARSCAWRRPRNIRTSPISSTAAARSPIPGEDRIMVPSPKVATYDLQPEMSAPELTDKAVEAIDSGKYDLIVLNFANPDMVGHTGSLPAAIKAVETVDTGLGRIADAIAKRRRRAAGHRRPRQLRTDARSRDRRAAHRAHHQSGAGAAGRRRQPRRCADGRLADLAPTMLALMELPQPKEMTGTSLLRATLSPASDYVTGSGSSPFPRSRWACCRRPWPMQPACRHPSAPARVSDGGRRR